MQKLNIILLLILMCSCKKKDVTESDFIAVEELSDLKEWIEIDTENIDTLSWGDLGKITGLDVRIINPEKDNLEFVTYDKSKTHLIYYNNNSFSVFKLEKEIEIEQVNYIVE